MENTGKYFVKELTFFFRWILFVIKINEEKVSKVARMSAGIFFLVNVQKENSSPER